MTVEQNFNKWFDEYADGAKVFEETDMKIAYLQGCADEVEKWEKINGELRTQLEQAEWHYVKDGKIPKFDEGTEIKFLKGKYTKAKRIVFCLCEDNDYQNIYAWKEIVLPEHPKEIE